MLVVTLLLIFIMAARTPLDTDMWWHLRSGEETLRTGQILKADIFSFTRAGTPWTNVYWLAAAGMALLFRGLGYLGLSAAVALLAVLSMALVWAQSEGPAFLKSAALLLGSVIASVIWSPRPQILSLVLVALVGYLLYRYKWRGVDRLWALPLVFVLWSNVHGGYPLGLILIGAVIAGETGNHLLHLPAMPWRGILRLAGWGVLCGLAVLVNPNGIAMWQLPFQTVNMQVLQQFIPEWASPDFHDVLQQALLWLLLLTVAAVALSGKVMDATDLLLLLGFTYMALLARRNFGPFALVTVPIFTRYASAALEGWQARAPWLARLAQKRAESAPEPAGLRRLKHVTNLLLVGLLGLVAFGKLYTVSHPALVDAYKMQGYPVEAARWLNANRAGERILNEYNWGGFLQWELEGFSLFVDGRTDLFGDEIVGAWMDAVQAGPGWEETLARYEVDLVMLERGRPLLAELEAAGWQRIYQDTVVAIYARE